MSVDTYVARADAEAAAAQKRVFERAATVAASTPSGGGFGSFVSTPPSHFAEIRPLPPLLSPVEPFPVELVPGPLRHWVQYHAQQLNCPPEFVAVPAMVAAAGCIGRQVGIRLRREGNYIELPILWGALIARPSLGKTPAQRPSVRLLQRIEGDMRKSWQCESAIRDRQAEFHRIRVDQSRKKAKEFVSQGKDDDALAALQEVDGLVEKEPEPRLMVNDSTVEKLAVLLSENQNGLVQVRDELTGWLSSLERDGANDRPFYLECWNGTTPISVDRITRQSIRVERPCLSIMGGIQPGRLDDYVRAAVRGGSGDDGLLQRFQLAVYPDMDPDWTFHDQRVNEQLEHCVLSIYRGLRNLDLSGIAAEQADWADVPFIELDDSALRHYVAYVEPLMRRLREGCEIPAMESHLGKYQALVGRLALVIHLLEGRCGMIGADTMLTAIAWADFLEPHARRMYGIAVNPGIAGAHRLLRKLGELPGDGFTARDVVRRCWSGIDQSNAPEACEILVDHGHLSRMPNDTETGGRPTVIYLRRPSP